MTQVSIIGATGYAGVELMRILAGHKEVKINHVVSKSFSGRMLSDIYPSFKPHDYRLEEMDMDAICKDSDIVYTCLPHGASAAVVVQLMERGVRVIDLSGDFRYTDAAVYEKWYNIVHPSKDWLKKSVYGMCEIYRSDIKTAGLVGNPGCYTTCSILALYPLLKQGVIEQDGIIIDAKSGATGAGPKKRT